jgi:hypothetical protein
MGRGLQPEAAAAARNSASTMAAAVFRSFGPPSVLQLVSAAVPLPCSFPLFAAPELLLVSSTM